MNGIFSKIYWNIMFLMTGAILILLFFVGGSGGKGEILTVDDDGEADFQTIQVAIDNAHEGDTVLVKSGTYFENVVVEKSITLSGEGPEATIINGNGSGKCIQLEVNDTNILNMKLSNADYGLYAGGSHIGNLNDVVVEEMDLKGIFLTHSSEWKFTNTSVSSCNIGIQLHTTTNTKIINSTIRENSNYNLYLYSSDRNSIEDVVSSNSTIGVILIYSDNNSFSNLTSMSNSNSGIFFSASSNNTITNGSVKSSGKKDIILDHGSSDSIVSVYPEKIAIEVMRNSIIRIFHELSINVRSADGSPVENVDVLVRSNGSVIYSTPAFGGNHSKTDSNGNVPLITFLLQEITERGITNFSSIILVKKESWEMRWDGNLTTPYHISIHNSAPSIDPPHISPETGDEQTKFNFMINCTDETLPNVKLFIDEMEHTLGSNGNLSFCTNLSFKAGSYRCRFMASDGLDLTWSENLILVVLDRSPPAQIENITIRNHSNGSIQFTWNASQDHQFSHYRFYYAKISFTSVEGIEPAFVIDRRNTTTMIISDLEIGIEYYFAITAVDQHGNENTSVVILKGVSAEYEVFQAKLEIERLVIEPKSLTANESAVIKYQLINCGEVIISEYRLVLTVDTLEIYNKTYRDIIPGNTTSGQINWVPTAGNHTLQILILYFNESRTEELNVTVQDSMDHTLSDGGERIDITNIILAFSLSVLGAVTIIICLIIRERGKKNISRTIKKHDTKGKEKSGEKNPGKDH